MVPLRPGRSDAAGPWSRFSLTSSSGECDADMRRPRGTVFVRPTAEIENPDLNPASLDTMLLEPSGRGHTHDQSIEHN